MKTVLAPRASAILYDLIRSQNNKRPFLLPANICPIVPLTFFKAKVPFEFVDISPRTLHMDLEQVEERLRKNQPGYRGLLYAHTYGDPFTPQEFFKTIKQHFPKLLIIDDRCLCIPQLESDLSWSADANLFSTGYSKIVDLGFGGFAFISDDLIYEHESLPFLSKDLETIEETYKQTLAPHERNFYSDSDWLETDSQLPTWRDFAERVATSREVSLEHRKSINAVYTELIPEEFRLADKYQLWRFNVRVPNKVATLAAIFDAHLFASSHYSSLSDIMGTVRSPFAEQLAQVTINLFNDRHFTLDMAERTAHIVLGSL